MQGIISVKANDNKILLKNGKQRPLEEVGEMKLMSIDPVLNPAQDNWLSREISRIIFRDEDRYDELTQEHFNSVTKIKYTYYNKKHNSKLFFVPEQIGNLINLEDLSIKDSFNFKILKMPKEISNLNNLKYLVIKGFSCTDEGLKEISKLPNLIYFWETNSNILNLGCYVKTEKMEP